MNIKGGIGAQTLIGTSGADTIYGGDSFDPTATTGAIAVDLVLGGLDQPLFVTSAPGDANGLYIVQKSGEILRYDRSLGTTTSFLDVSASDFSENGERGLLGLAFHNNYAANGKLYVSVTRADGDLQVREYTHSGAATAATNLNTRSNIITIEHSAASNHNGGWIGFHPTNGLLYIGVGDGGGGGDPEGDAQNVNSLLGKILRINVNSDQFASDATRNYSIPSNNPYAGAQAGLDEIFASGLRNPWRNSFDAAGNLWIADVGQSEREELNLVAASSNGGQNFGWNVREGSLTYAGGAFGPGRVTNPIYEYSHAIGDSVTGGYVYSGSGAGLRGNYIFGDFGSGRIFALERDGAVSVVDLTSALSQGVGSLSSFGLDGSGNLYAVDIGGSVYRLTPSAGAGDSSDVISGGEGADVIYGGLGNDSLKGDGGNDRLFGGVGNDGLTGGTGADTMDGGAGNDGYNVDNLGDRINEATNSGIDRVSASVTYRMSDNIENATLIGTLSTSLVGNSLGNTLIGNSGNNAINGVAGNDALYGGLGNDTLYGGAGNDAFVFTTAPGVRNLDSIRDFNPADDAIALDDAIFTALGAPGQLAPGEFRIGASAADADDHIIYNSANGALIYDSNGNAGGGAVQFASIAGGLALTNLDFFIV